MNETVQTSKDLAGGCLCGKVRFTLKAAPDSVSVCHCAMCRRWTGGPMMAVHSDGGVDFGEAQTLAWYRSSDWAERGFCSACGTSLFWRMTGPPHELAVAAGALDDTMALRSIANHIFVDEQPAFYAFADDAQRLTGAEVIAMFSGGEQEA